MEGGRRPVAPSVRSLTDPQGDDPGRPDPGEPGRGRDRLAEQAGSGSRGVPAVRLRRRDLRSARYPRLFRRVVIEALDPGPAQATKSAAAMERIVTEARVSWEQVHNAGTAWPRGTSAAGRQREATASASASKSRPVCRTVVPRRATWACSTPHATCSEEPGTQRARFSLRSPGSPRGGMSCALRARTSPSANRLSQTLPGSGAPSRPRRGSIARGSTASPEAP